MQQSDNDEYCWEGNNDELTFQQLLNVLFVVIIISVVDIHACVVEESHDCKDYILVISKAHCSFKHHSCHGYHG